MKRKIFTTAILVFGTIGFYSCSEEEVTPNTEEPLKEIPTAEFTDGDGPDEDDGQAGGGTGS